MKITEFFENDYVNYASYDNLRKIASVIDGQKNASRKILYTILEKNIRTKVKVSQLSSKVAEFAEYLHGSIDGVLVTLAQDFAGTNNIPLLQKKGNFGTRFTHSASASRYIYAYGTDEFFELFKRDDTDILISQMFEGVKIEPRYYVPTLPILLCNGAEGVSSGFAQKILPRNPKEIIKYIKCVLNGKRVSSVDFTPYFKGFNGSVEQGDNPAQWLIKGVVTRKTANRVIISEIPTAYELKQYTNILDKLEDDKIITSYKDLSDDDIFKFEVSIPSKVLSSWDDNTLLEKLKLVKKVTENYTATDENNKIKVFDGVNNILNHYIDVKLSAMNDRKEHLKLKSEENINFLYSKYLFIKMITEETLIINKRAKMDIVESLNDVDKIIKKDDSYDYLLNMNILSLTKERMQSLEADIVKVKQLLDNLNNTTPEKMWLSEL